jgi:hypothetical protein
MAPFRPGPGSGKLGTPCERMQSAYLTPAGAPLVALLPALLGLLEDPQPAITSRPDRMATAMSNGWGRARDPFLPGLVGCVGAEVMSGLRGLL